MTRNTITGTWTWVITLDQSNQAACRRLAADIIWTFTVPTGNAATDTFSFAADQDCTLTQGTPGSLSCSINAANEGDIDAAFLRYVQNRANAGTVSTSGAQWLEDQTNGNDCATAAVAIVNGAITFDGLAAP